MDYVQAIFSWVNAPLFATILLGMFWRRTTSAGAFWGLLLGMLTSITLFMGLRFHWFNPYPITFSTAPTAMARNLWQAWWAWLVTFVATAGISMFTKPKDAKELTGLVRGLTDTGRGKTMRSPLIWAGVAMLVLILLNILFW